MVRSYGSSIDRLYLEAESDAPAQAPLWLKPSTRPVGTPEEGDTYNDAASGITTYVGGSWRAGGGGSYGTTYAVYKTPGTFPTYTAVDAAGTVARSATDTAATSGLKDVLETLAGNGVRFTLTHTNANGEFTRFHCLDAPVGNEAWANTQAGLSFQGLRGMTIDGDGMDRTILSNRTNTTVASPDLGTLLFTNCFAVTVRDVCVEFGGSFLSTMEAVNCNQGTEFLFERVRFSLSRNSALIIDGGDKGRHAHRSVVTNCVFQGRPIAPQCSLVSQVGGLAANTYRYAVVWVDADLLGANTPGDTMPSEWTAVTTDASNTKVDVFLTRGPYTCTARKILRWDSVNGWRLLTTLSDNTTLVYRDDNTASPSAYTITDLSTIKSGGIHFLGCHEVEASGNVVDGCGSDSTNSVNGTNQYGINVVRKSVVPTQASRNRIVGNMVRKSGQHGIRISGGDENVVIGNTVVNPGIPAVKAQAIRIEGIAGVTTNRNVVMGNICTDDQDANSPLIGAPGKTMNNAITITATNAPTDNMVVHNQCFGGATAAAISDGGTTSRVFGNKGYASENKGAAASVADGGTIAHGLATTPVRVIATPTVASNFVSVTAVSSTTFTVAIKTDAGAAGTTQTIYWDASL